MGKAVRLPHHDYASNGTYFVTICTHARQPLLVGNVATLVERNYSRYRRRGDLSMDESFFPVLWDRGGYRTPWLSELPDIES